MTRPHPVLLGILLLAAPPLAAQPACTAAQAGVRLCLVGEACTCEWDRGGQLTATPPGWRWTCSLLETCGAPPPATLPPDPGTETPMMIAPFVQWNAPRR